MVSLGEEAQVGSSCETLDRPVAAEIDLSAIAGNVRAIKSLVGPTCRVLAVVKANGYGLGAQWVAQAALEGGASWLGVARVDEGVQLRRAGYTGPLLVMSYTPPEEAEVAVRNRLTLAVHRQHTALALEEAARSLGLSPGEVAVHLKVDTGLGRYGCTSEEFKSLAHAVRQLPHLRLEGLMTHFADADNPDQTFVRRQLALFNDLKARAAEEGIEFEIVHAANSAATLSLPEARLDMVRCGIVLSGHVPAPHLAGVVELKQTLTLRSKLARVFQASEGATVGYGRTWTAKTPALIGLVTVGYADGYRRVLSGRAEVLVRGRRVPVVGRVSMDQIGLDLTGVPEAREGDEVVLVGAQGAASVTVDDLAGWADTITYEILCGLSERVPRRYMHSGQAVEVCNLLGCSPVTERTGVRKELSR
ncbi:MAG: alanine racemase [Chloroflexota bacterium]|nr:alanine racemase [Chloroflexota bacterium]MDQ5864123.1 alanine racemase [Chloroflexota bacterium]